MAALNTLIEMILYGLATTGVLMLFHHLWKDVYQWIRRTYYGVGHRQLLRVSAGFRSQRKAVQNLSWNVRVYNHLETLLYATLKPSKGSVVSKFWMTSATLAGVTLILSASVTRNLWFTGLSTVGMLFIPYGLLQIRRYHISIRNSYDIVGLMDVLVPEYRKKQGSMMHTLKATAEELPSGPIRRAVIRLADRLSDYTTPQDARSALERFVKELGTTWAVQLANDIEHAIVDGVDVEYSLSLMHDELKDIEDARKEQNLARMDSLMVAMVPFIMWPVMMVVFYLTLTRNILVYQLDTPSGFKWFVLTLVSTLGSFLIGLIFYKPKQDI